MKTRTPGLLLTKPKDEHLDIEFINKLIKYINTCPLEANQHFLAENQAP